MRKVRRLNGLLLISVSALLSDVLTGRVFALAEVVLSIKLGGWIHQSKHSFRIHCNGLL